MATKFVVHVTLMKFDKAADETVTDMDILEEDEVKGLEDEYPDEQSARAAYASIKKGAGMSYDELLKWAAQYGKTEADVIRWYTLSECDAIREQTDEEMIEWLMAGVKYDTAYIKAHWDELDQTTQADYMGYMVEAWKAK